MSMKCCGYIPRALVVLGTLFGVFMASPASYAQQATTLQPAEENVAPEGSQIPEWRIQEIERKVRDYKAKMRATSPARQQAPAPQEEPAEPEDKQG